MTPCSISRFSRLASLQASRREKRDNANGKLAKKAGGKSEEDIAGDDNDKSLSSSTALLVIKVQNFKRSSC